MRTTKQRESISIAIIAQGYQLRYNKEKMGSAFEWLREYQAALKGINLQQYFNTKNVDIKKSKKYFNILIERTKLNCMKDCNVSRRFTDDQTNNVSTEELFRLRAY